MQEREEKKKKGHCLAFVKDLEEIMVMSLHDCISSNKLNTYHIKPTLACLGGYFS